MTAGVAMLAAALVLGGPAPGGAGSCAADGSRAGVSCEATAGDVRSDAAQAGRDARLDRLRAHWVAAVRDAREIDLGVAEEARVRAAAEPPPGSALDGALTAYRGGLEALRAHHASWPPTKLRHLRRGLATLDAVVQAHPRHVEVRYVRLMTCYYLPGILGRGWSVREDFGALGEVLPGARSSYPPELYRTVAGFVLEHGGLPPERRAALAAAVAAADE
jgi:hypothetical protein